MCTGYRGTDEARFEHFPYHQTVLHQATGVYEEMPAWQEDLSDCRDFADLPQEARDYLGFVEEFVGVPIALVSVGPARDQVIWTEAGKQTVAFQAVAA